MKDLLYISLVQTNIIWEEKAANLLMLSEKLGNISPAEVIVLPEMFATGFSMQVHELAETMEGNTVQWMKDMAAKKRCIITGSCMISDNGNYYNRMIWALPNGQLGYYNKRHLFAYAGEHEYFTAGDSRLIVTVNGWKILLLVCYDLRFPVWSRQQSVTAGGPEFDAIIYVANWPDKRNLAWKTLLQARAIENQCYVIGVNRVGEDGHENYYSGDSSVFDPMGNMVYQVSHKEEINTVALEATILQAIREKLPFLKDADAFSIMTEK